MTSRVPFLVLLVPAAGSTQNSHWLHLRCQRRARWNGAEELWLAELRTLRLFVPVGLARKKPVSTHATSPNSGGPAGAFSYPRPPKPGALLRDVCSFRTPHGKKFIPWIATPASVPTYARVHAEECFPATAAGGASLFTVEAAVIVVVLGCRVRGTDAAATFSRDGKSAVLCVCPVLGLVVCILLERTPPTRAV